MSESQNELPGIARLDAGAHVVAAAFDPGGLLGVALADGGVLLLDPSGDAPEGFAARPRLEAPAKAVVHEGGVLALAAHPVAGFLTGGEDGRLNYLSLDEKGAPSARLLHHEKNGWIDKVAVESVNGRFAASLGKLVLLFDPVALTAARLGPHPGSAGGLAFSPDGSRLAVSHNGGLTFWTVAQPGPQERQQNGGGFTPAQAEFPGGHGELAWSPDGGLLAVATMEKGVRLLETGDDPATTLLEGYSTRVRALSWAADSTLLLTDGAEALIGWPAPLAEIAKGNLAFAPREEVRVTAVAAHPRFPLALAGFADGSVYLADLKGGRASPLATVAGPDVFGGKVTALTWSGDGRFLAAGDESGKVIVLELAAALGAPRP